MTGILKMEVKMIGGTGSFLTLPINALDAVVAQYLGIKIPRAIAKLGNSDWGVKTISDLQRQYLKWDVEQLPALWAKLQTELETAKLSACFTERMKFFPNLHTIKMTGIPVHRALLGFRSGRSIHA